jgi:hypothetical protein
MIERKNKGKQNMKTNSSITINNKTYNVKLNEKTYGSGSYVNAAGVASVLRTVLKEMRKDGSIGYKKLWVKSETFAGGNSIDVYTHSGTNTELINDVVGLFQEGNFNGMIDLYEYGDRVVVNKDNGEDVEIGVKYTFYNNRSPYGTIEYRKEQYIDDCLDRGVTPTKAGVDNWLELVNS